MDNTYIAMRGVSIGAFRGDRAWRVLERFAALGYLFVIGAIFGSLNGSFLSVGTLTTTVQLSIPLFVVAVGMMVCLLCGEVDLSVGGTAGLSSTIAALEMTHGVAWPMAVLSALGVGLAVGAVNGALTAWVSHAVERFPSFLVTLAMLALTGGIAEALEPLQQAIPINNIAFRGVFGYSSSVITSATTWYAVVLLLAAYVALNKTSAGYKLYAVGVNGRAARFIGVQPARVKWIALTCSGVLASVGGLLVAGFVQSGSATLAQGMDVDAITAAVIGGTSIFGGRGTVVGTVIGVFILGVMNSGLMLDQVASNWELVLKGGLIVVAVGVGEYTRRRAATT